MKNIFFLFFTLNYRIKISLFFLLLFSVLSYFIEFLGIGLIPVFFNYLINPEHTTIFIKNFPGIDTENFIFLNYLDPKFFVLLIFFIFFFKNLFFFFLVYFENKVINNFAIYNAKRFFSYYINQRYTVHLSQDINKITRNIIIENESLKNSLLSFLGIIKEFIVIFFLVLILFFVNTLVTTYLVLFFSIIIYFRKLNRQRRPNQEQYSFSHLIFHQAQQPKDDNLLEDFPQDKQFLLERQLQLQDEFL